MKVKISQAIQMITFAIQAKVVPMLKGSPGTGKSQIIYQIAKAYNLEVIDLRLSQCDPTDLAGFPTIEGGKADYIPMKHFPIEGDALPEGKAGWLLFLDEANSAPAAIQAAAYKLVLDKMVGSHRLHKNVAMVLAGNLESDGAIVQPMSTALQSRLLHLELVVDAKEWDEWALAENFNPKITSYIKFKPSQLSTFSADHTDDTYACPRTWEFAQRILEIVPSDSPVLLPMLAGTLTEGVAREFLGFCRIYDDLVTIDQIKANPEGVKVPNEPSVLYAMTGSLAHNMDADNSAVLMKYIARLPLEFQVVCMREVVRRNRAMLANAAVQAWIADNRDALT